MWSHKYYVFRNGKKIDRKFATNCFMSLRNFYFKEGDKVFLVLKDKTNQINAFTHEECLKFLNYLNNIDILSFKIHSTENTIITEHDFLTINQLMHSLFIARALGEGDQNNKAPRFVLDNIHEEIEPFLLYQLSYVREEGKNYDYNSNHACLLTTSIPRMRKFTKTLLAKEWMNLNNWYGEDDWEKREELNKIKNFKELYKKALEYAKN